MVKELTDRQFRALNREMVEMVGQMEEYCRSVNAPLVIRKADGKLYELTVTEKMIRVHMEEDADDAAPKEVHAFLVTAEKALPAEAEEAHDFSLLDFSSTPDGGTAAPAGEEDLFKGFTGADLVDSYLYRAEHC